MPCVSCLSVELGHLLIEHQHIFEFQLFVVFDIDMRCAVLITLVDFFRRIVIEPRHVVEIAETDDRRVLAFRLRILQVEM